MFGVGGILSLLSYVLPIWTPPKLSDICVIQPSGAVVLTTVVSGEVASFQGAYFIQLPNANFARLSDCRGKGSCNPLSPEPFRGQEGSRVQAEYCGKEIVRVVVADREVYRLTQALLDEKTRSSRKASVSMGVFFLGISGFVALLRIFCFLRGKCQRFLWGCVVAKQSKRITWFRAFWLLFMGKPEVVGKGYKWKPLILVLALMWTLFPPVAIEFLRMSFLGAQPPEAPLISATGKFVHKFTQSGLKKVPYVEFEVDDGRRYVTSDFVMPSSLGTLARRNPPIHVYAEGFLLRDGNGAYWPIAIRTLDGTDLISPKALSDELQRGRHPWKVHVAMYLVAGVLWVISIRNVYRLKKKLLEEEV
jgi:hypothetical protein